MNIRLCNKIVFVIALFSASLLYAQDSASVTGTVRDASGASVANAQVTVSAADRGINRETTTNGDGEYSISASAGGAAIHLVNQNTHTLQNIVSFAPTAAVFLDRRECHACVHERGDHFAETVVEVHDVG